jgi:aldehyde dehydrogenase (NAD+)
MHLLTAPNTDLNVINQIHEKQVLNKRSVAQTTAAERIQKLKSIKTWVEANTQAIKDALYRDFRKPEAESTLGELYGVLGELNHTISHLKGWMKPQRVSAPLTLLGTFPKVVYEPKGNSLVIAPWNYPFNLAIKPLIQSIGAGNTVILKPSEMTPATSALIKNMIAELFNENEVAVIEGDASVSTHLLSLKFDHIFFTGSPAVGKIVMTAAAKNLTSVTLELGGKSPCIIDETADVKAAAERVAWGKFVNNGQTCIAPDYVFVHNHQRGEFINHFKHAVNKMYGGIDGHVKESSDYCRIVNAKHFERIKTLIDDAVEKGAIVELGGQTDAEQNFIAPTVLTNVKSTMSVMQDEIFGPVLPVIEYNNLSEVLDYVNEKEKPLALYIFSSNSANKQEILNSSSAGGTVVNDVLIHYGYPGLPFGGVNNSGIGKSGGHFGFLEFSNQRAFIEQKTSALKMFYPPYNERVKKMLNFLVKFS